MDKLILSFFLISSLASVLACNKGYGGFDGGLHGWGGAPVIVLPKPTLLPKLKQAYIDGKLSVNYHKIVAPSLKPLPYKKGVGWIGKGWLPHHHGFNGIGHDFYNFHHHVGVGKQGFLGKGIGFGKGIGIGYGKGVGVGVGYGKGYGYGAGPFVGPVGYPGVGITNTVSHNSVSVVEKGVGGLHQPIVGPYGIPG